MQLRLWAMHEAERTTTTLAQKMTASFSPEDDDDDDDDDWSRAMAHGNKVPRDRTGGARRPPGSRGRAGASATSYGHPAAANAAPPRRRRRRRRRGTRHCRLLQGNSGMCSGIRGRTAGCGGAGRGGRAMRCAAPGHARRRRGRGARHRFTPPLPQNHSRIIAHIYFGAWGARKPAAARARQARAGARHGECRVSAPGIPWRARGRQAAARGAQAAGGVLAAVVQVLRRWKKISTNF